MAAASSTVLMSTVAESLSAGAAALRRRSDSPRLDAELLLAKVLGLSRSALIARSGDPVADLQQRGYGELLARRASGVPVAYLTGTREFWSLPLHVTPAVLVPRPETEILVELALERLPRVGTVSVLDLGTGSGAIALAMASERPQAAITGVDVSPAALEVAIHNSRDLGLHGIHWRLGSWFDAVPGQRFDMILANPPYIAAQDPALEGLRAEPALALTCGSTGLEALAAIAQRAPLHLRAGGWLIVEHGRDQAAAVAQLFEQHGFAQVRCHSDFSGNPRVTLGIVHIQP